MVEADTAPSLKIEFGDGVTTVRLRARGGLEADLRRLSLRFRTGVQRSHGVLEVDLDELLTSLAVLAEWPHPSDVSWDPKVAALATDSARDAQTVARQLAEPPVHEEASPEALALLLGTEWQGALTDFQRRDIAKLLSLRHGANFSVPGAGKTRVGLAVFHALRQSEGIERLLVVGPKSCHDSWLGENDECLIPPLRMEVLAREVNPAANALIVNKAKSASQATNVDPRAAADAGATITEARKTFDVAARLAGQNAELKKRQLAVPDRLTDAAELVAQCANEFAEA